MKWRAESEGIERPNGTIKIEVQVRRVKIVQSD